MRPGGEAGGSSTTLRHAKLGTHARLHSQMHFRGRGGDNISLHSSSGSFVQAGRVLGSEATLQGSAVHPSIRRAQRQQAHDIQAAGSALALLFITPQFVNDFLGESDLAKADGFGRVTQACVFGLGYLSEALR